MSETSRCAAGFAVPWNGKCVRCGADRGGPCWVDYHNTYARIVKLEAAIGDLIAICEPNVYPQPDKPDSAWAKLQNARAAITRATQQD